MVTPVSKSIDVINTITPPQYKQHAHEWLIGHGMEICKARTPKCKECALRDGCQYHQTRITG
jgi:endonuclease-3